MSNKTKDSQSASSAATVTPDEARQIQAYYDKVNQRTLSIRGDEERVTPSRSQANETLGELGLTMPLFRYGMASRPFSLDMCPPGHVAVDPEKDTRFDSYFTQFGVLVYDAPISTRDAQSYNLTLLIPAQYNDVIADQVLDKSQSKYLKVCLEDDSIPSREASIMKRVREVFDGTPVAFESESDLIKALESAHEEREAATQRNTIASPTP